MQLCLPWFDICFCSWFKASALQIDTTLEAKTMLLTNKGMCALCLYSADSETSLSVYDYGFADEVLLSKYLCIINIVFFLW